MYKASFFWYQDPNYPIYSQLLKPIIASSSGDSSFTTTSFTDSKLIAVKLDFDLTEDFTYEIKSNYQNYGDILSNMPFVGSLMTYVDMSNNLTGALGGKSTASSDHMKFQTWKETEPFKMNFKFVLSNYSDPFIDVYAPAMAMASMSILSPVSVGNKGNFEFKTPGVNSYAIKGLKRDTGGTSKNSSGSSSNSLEVTDSSQASKTITDMLGSSSKIIKEFVIWSEKIDEGTSFKQKGMLSGISGVPLLIVRDCFIESAKPTWSKDRTASGIPIWCELELGVQSIFSANDSMFSYLTKSNDYGGFGDAAAKVATNIFR